MGRAQTLVNIVHEHNFKRGVELGVYEGETTEALLKYCPELFMIGVDTWESHGFGLPKDKMTGIAPYAQDDLDKAYAKAIRVYARYSERLSLMKMRTEEAAAIVSNEILDFVFIDADHSTEGVLKDIKLWSPKIRRGGILCGHDEDWPSVRRALNASFNGYELKPGNVWAVQCL